MEIELKKQLIREVKMLQIELTEMQIQKFHLYMQLLLEWNKKINLTSIKEPNEIVTKHFVDSLSISKWIKSGNSIVDVGTGAGFPGVPLSILKGDCQFLLIDSLNKRVVFLQEVVNKLQLNNINVNLARVEEAAHLKEYREGFDVATSRAVANMSTLLEYLLPFCKNNGIAICMKGNNVQEELNKCKKACNILKGQIEEIDKFCLPYSNYERNIIIVKKNDNIPNQYPRKQGKPSKEPLM